MAKKLTVEIGADISDLKQQLQAAVIELEKFRQQKSNDLKLGLDTTNIQASIEATKAKVLTLQTAMTKAGGSVETFGKKTKDGGQALTAFSRIAQDAPYGIIGIGNNITNTAEQFGYLVKETGSAGGAIKAMLGSMMGIGGIMMGVSLLVTGLTIMSQKGITVSDVMSKLAGTFDENRRELQKLNEEAAKNAAAQTASVEAYVSAAKNINLSMADRLIAVKKLQDEYPAYFGNLSNEQILNGNVASAVRGVTQALIAKAKAASYVNKITELAEKEANIHNRINNELYNIAKAYELNSKEAAAFNKAVLAGGDAFKLLDPYKKRAGFFDVASAVNLNSALADLNTELKQNVNLQDKYTAAINQSVAASIKLEATPPPTPKKAKATKETDPRNTALDREVKNYLVPAPLFDSTQIEVFNGQIDQFGNKIKSLPGIIGLVTTKLPGSIVQPLSAELIAALEELEKFNDSLNSVIQGAMTDAFTSIGSAIGGAMGGARDAMSSLGSVLLGTFGSLLTTLGGMMIKMGVSLLMAKLALKSMNPYLAIAGGVALVAIGSLFSSQTKSLGGSGGSTGGGGVSTSGGSSQNISSNSGSGGSFGGGTVVFEISGQALIGVLSNTLDKNRRLGGSGLTF